MSKKHERTTVMKAMEMPDAKKREFEKHFLLFLFKSDLNIPVHTALRLEVSHITDSRFYKPRLVKTWFIYKCAKCSNIPPNLLALAVLLRILAASLVREEFEILRGTFLNTGGKLKGVEPQSTFLVRVVWDVLRIRAAHRPYNTLLTLLLLNCHHFRVGEFYS